MSTDQKLGEDQKRSENRKQTDMKAGVDYIGVGVGALIFDDQGKILMSLRGPKARNEAGKWEVPGGAVEYGETFEAALVREVFEELGIHVRVKELLQVCDHILVKEQEHWVAPTYMCEIVSGTPCIQEPEKCTQIGWYSLEEAEQLPLAVVTASDIKKLREMR